MKKILSFLVIITISSVGLSMEITKPHFNMTKKEIEKTCKDLVNDFQTKVAIITNNKKHATFNNTVVSLEYVATDFYRDVYVMAFLGYVSPHKDRRDQASQCEVAIKKASIDIFTNQTLFDRFEQIKKSKQFRKLKGEDYLLFDDYYRGFLSNGLGIKDDKKREKIASLKKELTELTTQFGKNIREKMEEDWLTKDETEGLSKSFLEGLETKKGKYKITPDYPIYFPVMKNAKSESARKKMRKIFATRGGSENVKILEDVLAKRQEIATLMGYKSHAHGKLALSGRMASSPEEVRDFIGTLNDDLRQAYDKEFEVLQKLKCKETKCKDYKKQEIQVYDIPYYQEKVRKNLCDLDFEKIKEYFPLDKVTSGMFSIYEKLMGISIVEKESKNTWHEDVRYFHVYDKKTSAQIGEFYLDMFPREGKYGHAAVWALRPPRLNPDGSKQIPMSAMVCNFNPPSKDRPSLLTHDEVETYFHEFGHLVHNMVSNTKYASQGGTSVARDFVEAPSQMLENWVWQKESLGLLSAHYKTGKPIPNKMLNQMLALKKVNIAMHTVRQLFLATIDLDYHTMKAPVDTSKHWAQKMKEMLYWPEFKGTYYQAGFGHLMGYDAGYYGYMWSKVYAQDMFSVFEKKGILNPDIGKRYRDMILAKGGSVKAYDLLKKFLKRKPNNKAFLKSLGL